MPYLELPSNIMITSLEIWDNEVRATDSNGQTYNGTLPEDVGIFSNETVKIIKDTPYKAFKLCRMLNNASNRRTKL